MPEDEEFAALYKRLIQANLTPDPRRGQAALAAVLRSLSAPDIPAHPNENTVENTPRL